MKRKTKEAEPMAPPESARARVTVTTRSGGSRVIPAPASDASEPAESATAPSLERGLDPIAESTLAPLLADAEPDSNGDH